MSIQRVETKPIDGQKPGTSGLRKKVVEFQKPHYTENFVQSIFNSLSGFKGKTLVVGGDGRFHNDVVIQTVIRMAAANGFGTVIVGQGGILSTPAASNIIRKNNAFGGIILSASHNPGGPVADFGIKYNISNGGPAPENITDQIFKNTTELDHYLTVEAPDVDLSHIGETKIADLIVSVIDTVSDYADLMETLFDFPSIQKMIVSGFTLRFDAMNAVTGPYAREVLVNRLGASDDSVVNDIPLPDFGGMHPDPNLVHAKDLYDLMYSNDAPDFGAASDGDGDRNLIIGRNCFVNPSDAIAVLAANAQYIPAFKSGLSGLARSMPTSSAIDLVAKRLGLECYETPTGWKFFGNLLDADRISICGEESAGAGSNHVREKDGLWAVLFWLNIQAATGKRVDQIMEDHWRMFGRTFYSRHDYEEVDTDAAGKVMSGLIKRLNTLSGESFYGRTITLADEFSYLDPVDQSISQNQGVRLIFEDGARIILRLSGTGTSGATIRIYLEQQSNKPDEFASDPQDFLGNLIKTALEVTDLQRITGRSAPSLIT